MNDHRQWVNRRLLEAAAGLSDEQLHAARSIGQGSIWKSLVHMYAAEYVWLGSLEGDEQPLLPGDVRGKLPGNQLGEGGLASLAELREGWAELDERWLAYLDRLTAESLDETVYKVTSVGAMRLANRRSDVLLHVCLHAHYTAAQSVNMLRQAGVESVPDSMLVTMARQEV